MSIIDDNKDKIKKELKQIIEKDENLLSHAELKNNAKRPHFMKDGIILDLNQEVFNSIHNASKLILEDDYIKKTYSPYHIEKKIREIIVKTFSENKTDRIRYLEEKIETLRNDLKAEVKDWLIRIPIYNLIIDGDIEMGKVKFFTLNESKAEEMEQELEAEDETLYDICIKPNIDATIAEIKVKGINEYAQHIAMTKINLAINALKLFISRNLSQFKIKGTMQENITRVSYLYSYNNENDNVKISNILSETIGQIHPVRLKKTDINEIEGIKILSDMLKKNKFSQFEQQLLLGIIWFSEALSIYDHSEKYLPNESTNYKTDDFIFFKFSEMTTKLFTSLESILIVKEGEPIRENLSERIAILLQDNYDERIKLKKKIKNLYDNRSKIIHSGDFFISKNEFYELLGINRNVLIKLVKLNNKYEFKNMIDLETYFNKIKYDN